MIEQSTLTNLELTRFFFSLVFLLASAHTFGYLFHKIKMPRVIGEIMGGLMLGPTVGGYIFPDFYQWVFDAFTGQGKLLSAISWIGLTLLMFVSGFEIRKTMGRGDKKLILALLLGATTIPFIAGWLAPRYYDFTPYLGTERNMLALNIIVAIAVAVTSIPVISKIFLDLKIADTRFANIILTTATIQDVILWIALAVATGILTGNAVTAVNIGSVILITLAFFATVLILGPQVARIGSRLKINALFKSSASGYALFICFFVSAIASVLNVNVVFGAFLAGIVVGKLPEEQFGKIKLHIREVSLAFFVPIYFALVGLKLDLIHHFDFRFFLCFLLFSACFETFGTILAARIMKNDWLSSFNLSVAMNTRGGPGIVLATVALDMGIINQTFFAVLVMTAIITSLLAGVWFHLVISKDWKLLK